MLWCQAGLQDFSCLVVWAFGQRCCHFASLCLSPLVTPPCCLQPCWAPFDCAVGLWLRGMIFLGATLVVLVPCHFLCCLECPRMLHHSSCCLHLHASYLPAPKTAPMRPFLHPSRQQQHLVVGIVLSRAGLGVVWLRWHATSISTSQQAMCRLPLLTLKQWCQHTCSDACS